MRRRAIFPFLLGAALAGPAAAPAGSPPPVAPPAEFLHLPAPAGLGRLILPLFAGPALLPLVIVIPDSLGEDGRSEAYAEALSARGIAVLALGLGADADGGNTPMDPAASPAAAAEALRWAVGRFAPGMVGLLGFGAGGRAVLAAPGADLAVALYPGCRGLPLPAAHPAVILHGAEAPDAPDCASLPEVPDLLTLALPGLGHGWDVPAAPAWPGPLLPEPGTGRRIRAASDPARVPEVAELVAGLFAERLAPAREAAR